MNPIFPDEEIAKGSIALWLSPEEITFIANKWRKIQNSVSLEVKINWDIVAFRAMAALHKAKVMYGPLLPNDSEIYHLANH